MGYTKNLKKYVASVVIIAVIFQGNIFLRAQQNDEIISQFDKAVYAYISGQDDSSKVRLERVISNIQAKSLDVEKKDILGSCLLLLGAIYEKEESLSLAEENYRKAKEYGVESIDGVDLSALPIYRMVVKDDIETLFQKTVAEYNNGQYDNSKSRLEQVIGTIKERKLDKKEILGKCYLLLGAIYEKKGEKLLAEENYRRAKVEYGVESVEGAALGNLSLYRKIIKGEKMIEGEGKKPETKKKKFPVLLVIGGVVVVVAVVMLLIKKKKTSPTPEFVTSTDSLNVPEGGTADFNIRLSSQPSSTVSVSVTRVSGDTDINVQSGSSLTFTTANWNQNQTVTLAANEDGDTSNGSATIRISASGIQNKDLTATEQENDTLDFITSTNSVTINEGATASFDVKLSNQPDANIQAAVTWVSGDTDISVESGASLTFTTSDWNVYQTVILRAAEDADTTNGQAVIRISANGIPDKDITAIESDKICNISITITSPSNNETVRGTVTIQATVISNCVVNRVEFYIDGILKGIDTSEPYSYAWDTTTAFLGPHALRVVAYSTTGNNNDSQITVTVTR